MPCHPARARKLLRNGRAVPHHIRGIFGIRLLDCNRAECEVQGAALRINPGSVATGIAVTTGATTRPRTVLSALEIKHRAFTIKATMTQRRQHRRNRRSRLRHRAPRFDNRKRKPGTLPPSVDSLRVDTLRIVNTLLKIYPISSISIERNKFDPQLMMNPDIRGVEYQRGTLFGWQVRAYVLERDQGSCVYCRRSNVRLELDHVRPRAVGSDRVDNLVACCRDCNIAKGNRPVEEFLANQPEYRDCNIGTTRPSRSCCNASCKDWNAPTSYTPPTSTPHCRPWSGISGRWGCRSVPLTQPPCHGPDGS